MRVCVLGCFLLLFPFNVADTILLRDRIVGWVEFGAWGEKSRNVKNCRAAMESRKPLMYLLQIWNTASKMSSFVNL